MAPQPVREQLGSQRYGKPRTRWQLPRCPSSLVAAPGPLIFRSNQPIRLITASPIPLRHGRLVDAAIAPTSPSRWQLVAGLCLIAVILTGGTSAAVILTGGTSAVIAFRQFPLADIWRDHVSSWMEFERLASTMGRQQGFPRLKIETSRGMSGEPIQLALAIEGSGRGRGRDYHRRAGWNGYFNR